MCNILAQDSVANMTQINDKIISPRMLSLKLKNIVITLCTPYLTLVVLWTVDLKDKYPQNGRLF